MGNSFLSWWRRSSISEILTVGILALSLASGAVWFFRSVNPFSGPVEGSLRVNVNTATLTELETLPGIGPSLAASIVAGRPYKTVDALVQVRGIGSVTLDSLRPYVKVEGETERIR